MNIISLMFTKSLIFSFLYYTEGFSVSSPQSSVPSTTGSTSNECSTYTISFPNISKNDSNRGGNASKKELYNWFNDLVSRIML